MTTFFTQLGNFQKNIYFYIIILSSNVIQNKNINVLTIELIKFQILFNIFSLEKIIVLIKVL